MTGEQRDVAGPCAQRRHVDGEYTEPVIQVVAKPPTADLFEQISDSKPVQARAQRLIRAQKGPEIVFGADRLDYTKGIPERIRAFERLLERHPEHRERVVLLQLAVPSRSQVAEYREIKRELDTGVATVKVTGPEKAWSPEVATFAPPVPPISMSSAVMLPSRVIAAVGRVVSTV